MLDRSAPALRHDQRPQLQVLGQRDLVEQRRTTCRRCRGWFWSDVVDGDVAGCCPDCDDHEAVTRNRTRAQQRVAGLLVGDPGALVEAATVAVVNRAGCLVREGMDDPRRQLAIAVRAVAESSGRDGTRANLIELAAVAIAWAADIPREPETGAVL